MVTGANDTPAGELGAVHRDHVDVMAARQQFAVPLHDGVRLVDDAERAPAARLERGNDAVELVQHALRVAAGDDARRLAMAAHGLDAGDRLDAGSQLADLEGGAVAAHEAVDRGAAVDARKRVERHAVRGIDRLADVAQDGLLAGEQARDQAVLEWA